MMRWKEGKSGKKGYTQDKRIQKVVAGFKHEGDIVHTGRAGRRLAVTREGEEGTRSGHRGADGMGEPAHGAGLCWKNRAARGRDGSFCGAHRQAGAAGVPRGHVGAALQTSKSHLADKNLFGPPGYYYVRPPSPAHPFCACQAPQLCPATPVVIPLTTRGHLAGKLARSTP